MECAIGIAMNIRRFSFGGNPGGHSAAATLLDVIQEAEAAGVAQLWMTQTPTSLDALTIFAAAFGKVMHLDRFDLR